MPVEFLKYKAGSTVQVKITQACAVAGQHLKVGTVIELPFEDAQAIIGCGRGEKCETPAEPEKEEAANEAGGESTDAHRGRARRKG